MGKPTLHDFGEVAADAAQHLHNCLVVAGRDARLLENGLAHVRVADAQGKLLLLGGLGGGQMRRKESLEGGGNLVLGEGLDVLESFLGSFEWLVGLDGDHLGEAFEGVDGLLDLGQLGAGGVVLLLLEEAVSAGGLVENEQLHVGYNY